MVYKQLQLLGILCLGHLNAVVLGSWRDKPIAVVQSPVYMWATPGDLC